jgi:hypothetical protein
MTKYFVDMTKNFIKAKSNMILHVKERKTSLFDIFPLLISSIPKKKNESDNNIKLIEL